MPSERPIRHPVTAEDLGLCCENARTAILEVPDDAWDSYPSNSEWDRRKILRHVTWAILGYASLLATKEDYGPIDFLLLESRRDPAIYTANRLSISVELLIAVTRGNEPTSRAWHPHGTGDAEGFLALACSEISMHLYDVMVDLPDGFRIPDDVASKIVKRLYPWSPTDTEPWETLKWATGRAELAGKEPAGGDWRAFLSPLEEWDGQIWKRPPGYRLPDIGHPPLFQD